MLENLYAGGGESTRLSTLKNHFYTAIPAVKEDILYELKQKGLYTVDPDSAHAYLIGTVVAMAVVLLLLNHFGHFPLLQSGGWSCGCGHRLRGDRLFVRPANDRQEPEGRAHLRANPGL